MNRKFKKILSAVLAVVMVLSVLPVYALEEGVTYEYDAVDDPLGYIECEYDIYNGKARILKYTHPNLKNSGLDKETMDETIEKYRIVTIPETINGYEVGYIGESAFFYTYYDDVGDPHGKTNIRYANEVFLPDTIIDIHGDILAYSNLSRLVMPNNAYIIKCGLEECNISEIILPQNIETLDLALWNCYVSKIVVPGSVKNFIRRYNSQSYIDTLIISEGVEDVGDLLFKDISVKQLYLPKSLKVVSNDDLMVGNTVFYNGTRDDWGKIDPGYHVEQSSKQNYDIEFIYQPSPYTVESVDIVPETVDIVAGNSKTLEATIKGNTEDTSIFTPVYKSSDESIATVDQSGKVTALKKGTATITCTASDDNKTVSDTCTVNVVNAVEKVEITPDILEFYSGKSETLTTNITANTTDTSLYTVTYTSSDEDVATVDENGEVTAYIRGTATITCTVTDDNGNTVSDTCEVTVKYTFWRWLLRVFLYIIGVNSKI